jgi:ribosomal protein S18 acetylase RimI-like enzyme
VNAPFTVRPVRHRDEVLEWLATHEPRATRAVADLLQHGVRRRRCRCWVVERNGERAAALVVTRVGFDQWLASCLVLDAAAGPLVASLVDVSPAWAVLGSQPDLEPVVGALRRPHDVYVSPWAVVAHPVRIAPPPDERTRRARRGDLGALVELLDRYELGIELTRWQVRATVRTALRSGRIDVADIGGRVVGALVRAPDGHRFGSVAALTVAPEHRRDGLGWALLGRGQAYLNEHRLGAAIPIAPSNPIVPPPAALSEHRWWVAALDPPQRWRGQARLRSWYARIQPRRSRRAEWFRDLTDPDRRTGT